MFSVKWMRSFTAVLLVLGIPCLVSAQNITSLSSKIIYPNYNETSIALASFQDSIEVLWGSLPNNIENTLLQVLCWNRDLDWVNTSPLLTQNISVPSGISCTVALEPYKKYNPCQFSVGWTPFGGNFTWLFPSGGVAIDQTIDPNGPTVWAANNPAPMGSYATNVTASTSAGRKSQYVQDFINWLVTILCVVELSL